MASARCRRLLLSEEQSIEITTIFCSFDRPCVCAHSPTCWLLPYARSLLDHSDGVTVRIVRLIEALAIDAIRSGRERIDMESFSVVPSLPLLLSMEDRPHAGIS
jgi:hypothetical protein